MDILKAKRERYNLVLQAREILDAAESAKRDMSGEETTKYEALMADVDRKTADINKEERLQKAESEMRMPQDNVPGKEQTPGQLPGKPDERKNPRATEEYRKAFSGFLSGGLKGLNQDEYRALQMDQDIYGGFITTPEQFINELIKAVDNEVFMRGLATIYSVPNAASLGAPALDNDPADPAWTIEIGTGNEDSTMSFGKRELHPHPLAKLIKVSQKLLRAATIGAEGLVRDRLSYKFAVTEENCFLNGTGVNQPLGVFVNSSNGISSTYDVSTGNTSTSIQTDGLIEAKYSLKGQYWGRAKWLFHRDAVKQIRKLKTGEGDYIWQPGISAATPDRILEVPYVMSEYAPNTFSSGAYVGIIGDFSKYWIVDALNMQIQRLDELYAATAQVGFIGRLECDGQPVLGEAFRRVTLG
jgi:HK97 family phage major capsid protein